MQAAHGADHLVAGPQAQVIRVGQDHRGAEALQILGVERLNRRQRAHGHELRRVHHAMRRGELAGAGEVRDGGSFFDRMGSVVCWNSVMDENQYMVRKWNEFIAA